MPDDTQTIELARRAVVAEARAGAEGQAEGTGATEVKRMNHKLAELVDMRREGGPCRIICRELTTAPNQVCGRHYPFGCSTATRTVLALHGTDLKELALATEITRVPAKHQEGGAPRRPFM
jgi:hypothetical protein